MWYSLVLALAVSASSLYLPGFFVVRSLHASRIVSVVCAPFVALFLYSVLVTAYHVAGVPCNAILLVVPAIILGLALWGVSRISSRRSSMFDRTPSSRERAADHKPQHGFRRSLGWPGLCLYASVGIATALYVLLANMESAESFVQYYDNVHHLGSIRSFIDSGNWSSFDVSLYSTAFDAAIRPIDDGGFYPSAWHVIAALAASVPGVSIPVAQNAAVIVFAAVVFPTGMFLLFRRVFEDRPSVVFFGAFATMAFAVFPWRLVTFGPLFPNLAAFSMIPAVAACFVSMFSPGVARRCRLSAGVLFALGVLGIAFTHPNGVFGLAVLLVPFVVMQAGRLAERFECDAARRRALRVGFCAAAVLLIVLVWAGFYSLPFMQGVVSYSWPSYTAPLDAAKETAKLMFLSLPAQKILAALVLVGAMRSLKHRQYLWITCSYALVCVMYVVAASSDGFLKHFLTGFWYTDPYRIAACVVLAGVPLAGYGLASLRDALLWALRRISRSAIPATAPAAALIVSVGFVIANFYPHYLLTGTVDDENAFDVAGSYVRDALHDGEHAFYDDDEREFVREAMGVIPSGSLVVNVPADGSAFAYGADGLRTYYRYYDCNDEDDDASRAIRTGLSELVSNESAKEAVGRIEAQYVLLLDADPEDQSGVYDEWLDREAWRGIWSIRDDTPGFEVVLSRGDMRLYHIEDAGAREANAEEKAR